MDENEDYRQEKTRYKEPDSRDPNQEVTHECLDIEHAYGVECKCQNNYCKTHN